MFNIDDGARPDQNPVGRHARRTHNEEVGSSDMAWRNPLITSFLDDRPQYRSFVLILSIAVTST